MNNNHSGIIFDIKEFAVHDGPGIRTTVFLKGCPMDCTWCHNPEGKTEKLQIMHSSVGERVAGWRIRATELAARLNRQVYILRANEGGVTFSGGEPLQQAAFVAEVIDRLEPIHVLLDTSGFGSESDFRLLAERVDLVYFDLKIIDEELHQRYTGQSNRPVLRNLDILSKMGLPFVVRVPLIPRVTDTKTNITAIAGKVSNLPVLPPVELLPYNPLAGAKYGAAGMKFNPGFDPNQPVETHLKTFTEHGLAVKVRRSMGESSCEH